MKQRIKKMGIRNSIYTFEVEQKNDTALKSHYNSLESNRQDDHTRKKHENKSKRN